VQERPEVLRKRAHASEQYGTHSSELSLEATLRRDDFHARLLRARLQPATRQFKLRVPDW